MGVNDLDNACRIHDIEYSLHINDKKALMDSDSKLAYIAGEISNALKQEINRPDDITSFLEYFGIKMPTILTRIVNYDKTYDKLAADAVWGIFKGKGLLERFGLMDPKNFAKGLGDGKKSDVELEREGLELWEKVNENENKNKKKV